jgi:putative NADH-flavin reductase
MKICIITSSFPAVKGSSANAGSFVLDFAEELQARGHEVTVITPQKTKIDSLKIISYNNQ